MKTNNKEFQKDYQERENYSIDYLENKALSIRKKTLEIHKQTKEIRIASCLSPIEIFTSLYYGKILKFNPKKPYWEYRDRMIISKAHGAISLYPILADLGFFNKKDIETVCKEGSYLGSIPDSSIPGFEIFAGSLGHGLGIGCGTALALKNKNLEEAVIVLSGDGELFEGAVWEAIMFAGQHKLDNLLLIVDNNKKCMLGYCKNVIDLNPLDKKFEAFGWDTKNINGHNLRKLYPLLKSFKYQRKGKPKVLIADTIKGKGIPDLEEDPICHVKSVSNEKLDKIIGKLK